ncbi:MAG: OmpA family protein [Elusimicrobia bacterium]|nr:OmpA family protein [Elusimicrobiota bacterium]
MKNKIVATLSAIMLCVALTMPAMSEFKGASELSISGGAMVFEGGTNMDAALMYGARLGYFFTEKFSGELSAFYGQSETGGVDVETLYPAGAFSYHFGSGKLLPFLQAGAGVLRFKADGASAQSDFAAHWGLGLKWFVKPKFAIRLDAAHVINTETKIDRNNFLGTLGFSWLFGNTGRETPKPVEAVKEVIEPPDTDGDGVKDATDSCPNTLPGLMVSADGCPLDSDKDGVADYIDSCPNTPAATAVDEKGCPLAKPDIDADGVDDSKDQCPQTPVGTAVDEKGCPLAKDADADGVYDDKDECPQTPAGTAVDEKGCPVGTKALPVDEWILKGITFKIDSDIITDEGKLALDEAVGILAPRTAVRVEIAGHTDNTGSPDYNMALSGRRAESVKKYLVEKGIAADRLETKGYGDTQPIADNKTREGRSTNRRIEFKVLSK